MALFHFVSVWRIESPIDPVWDAIYRFEDWPKWWRGVEQTDVVDRGDANRIGFRTREVWKSKLPYTLRFETTVSRMEPKKLIEVQSSGELDGTGLMRFAPVDGGTLFQVDWTVRTTKLWMTLLTPILRPAYAWNHETIMNWGAEGLSKKLGIKPIVTSKQPAM
ncbi:MAG TPA: SRPBCC family protein [Bryobacteraceae bacterium]|nr:SRPBCC family protein [Bryobacteraceae bacterium]